MLTEQVRSRHKDVGITACYRSRETEARISELTH